MNFERQAWANVVALFARADDVEPAWLRVHEKKLKDQLHITIDPSGLRLVGQNETHIRSTPHLEAEQR